MKSFEVFFKSLRTAFSSARPDRDRMLVEALEPRILHSADVNPLQMVDQGSETVAEIRYLGSDGEFQQHLETAEQQQSRSVIFVDTATPDYQDLIDQIVLDSDRPDEFEIVLIDPDSNGIDQISAFLFGQNDLSSVHIISHGSDAKVHLGQGVLDANFISEHAGQISQWGDAFSPDADLLIYGCDVAGSDAGRALVDTLARLTGADVAASEDLTGHALLGGDWELEYRTGSIEAGMLLDASGQDAWLNVLPKLDITARETVDADADGMIDHIRITTEPATLNDDFSDLAITVAGYALDTINPYVTDLDGLGANDEVFYVKLQESGNWDTGATPDVKVVSNSNLKDGKDEVATDAPGGNGVAATDAAAPVLVSSETVDANMDGYINAVRLTYSEAVTDASVNAADWDVAGVNGEVFFTGAVANDAMFYILFDDQVLNTGATPDVTYTQNAIVDSAGNLAAGATITSVDKAAPVLMAVTGFDAGASNVFGDTGDVLEFVFSETIAAVPTETDSEAGFVLIGVDGDNFPTEVGGDTTIELFTTNVTNDTLRYTFSAGIRPAATRLSLAQPRSMLTWVAWSPIPSRISPVTTFSIRQPARHWPFSGGSGPVRDNDAAADAVAENAIDGTIVGITAFADDPNVGDDVTYSLTDTAGGRFKIDSATGVVTVDGTGPGLDFEGGEQSRHRCTRDK